MRSVLFALTTKAIFVPSGAHAAQHAVAPEPNAPGAQQGQRCQDHGPNGAAA
jgi:hypothetical protein